MDDLATPRFPEQATAAFAAMAEMAPYCVLEPEALMEMAVEQTGLTDFGDPSFREPLGVLCAALRNGVCRVVDADARAVGVTGPGVFVPAAYLPRARDPETSRIS